jgi:UDP-glucose:(heptosyl)LPS alpha-1,3-glucosyltransferase
MKVAILKGHLGPGGGLEKTTLRLARRFADHGCVVTILTTGQPPSLPGILCHSFGAKKRWSYQQLLHFDKACQEWLLKNPQDVVFGMERNASQTHYRAGSGVHAAYLQRRELTDPFWKRLSFKFNPLHRRLLNLENQCFTGTKLIFTNSEMVKREISLFYEVPSSKIEVVHNGAPYEEWKKAFEESCLLRRKEFQFLFVGNGFRRKGLHFLLQGLSLLPQADLKLVVVGKDKEMDHFQRFAKKLKVNAQFVGPQNEIVPFYQQSDSLVIPSTYDPFAGVTTEALAMGLFVVSSKYNGGSEVLLESNGCVIDDLLDPISVLSSLKKALLHPKTVSQARAIRETIVSLDFSRQLDKIVHKTLETK